MLRYFLICLTALCLISFLNGCSGSNNDKQSSSSVEDESPVDSLIITVQGVEGKSVFELTQMEHDVKYLSSISGNFVDAIDSIPGNSDYGWMYSVNDSMGQVASDKYITNDGDIIKWHYRKF